MQNSVSIESTALTDDLLTEILLRLPVTSILRFKAVSKHWRLLLSDRRFTLRFDSLSKSPGLFIRNTYVPFDVENRSIPPYRRLDFYPDPCGIKIVQSCNGLLLCCSDQASITARKYYVFNPTTKQFAIIPSIPGDCHDCFMGLAFHQTDCVHYKVVCIRRIGPDGKLSQILIYSSDTGKWKISIESFYAGWAFFGKPVYWNGAIHWAPSHYSLVYFKIEAEQLQKLPFPVDTRSLEYIGESRGHLDLIATVYDEDRRVHVNVYEMLSDHSGWFVKYRVDLVELRGALQEMTGWPYVVDVVRGAEEEDTFIAMTIPGKIIRYNVYDKSFKKVSDLIDRYYENYVKAHRYTEILSSF